MRYLARLGLSCFLVIPSGFAADKSDGYGQDGLNPESVQGYEHRSQPPRTGLSLRQSDVVLSLNVGLTRLELIKQPGQSVGEFGDAYVVDFDEPWAVNAGIKLESAGPSRNASVSIQTQTLLACTPVGTNNPNAPRTDIKLKTDKVVKVIPPMATLGPFSVAKPAGYNHKGVVYCTLTITISPEGTWKDTKPADNTLVEANIVLGDFPLSQ